MSMIGRTPDFQNPGVDLFHGDCLDIMRDMPECSVDSIVTDPPYGLSFMSKKWDHGVPGIDYWKACLRVAKPGAHMLAFGGTRTHHRLMCAIEDAGWEIRDCIMWVYGSGMPKSHDVSKAIDKAAGAVREVVGRRPDHVVSKSWRETEGRSDLPTSILDITIPSTDAAKQWQGWGTALKPAWEPIIVARKPIEGTVAANVLKYGTGGINIDASRVETEDTLTGSGSAMLRFGGSNSRPYQETFVPLGCKQHSLGRFPANLIHDRSDEVLAGFPEVKSGGGPAKGTPRSKVSTYGTPSVSLWEPRGLDSGSAARYFYCAKASPSDREEGNNHPTVKPTTLMQYLAKLVTPPNGIILDPFMGSGSTGKAAIKERFRFIGCELDRHSFDISVNRITAAIKATAADTDDNFVPLW